MAAGKAHVQFRLNRRPKSPPLASKLTDNDDFLGGKSRDEHAHPSAECMDHAIEGFSRERISRVRQSKEIRESQTIGGLDRFVVVAQGRTVGCVDLPASPPAASTKRSIRIERHVAKFSSHTVESADQLAVGEHSGADPFGNSHHHEVADLFSVSKPNFSERARICSVFQLYTHRSEERRVGKECRSRWGTYH